MDPRIKQIGPFGDVLQKTSPIAADRIPLDDSADSFKRKYSELGDLFEAVGGGINLHYGGSMGSGDVGKYFEAHATAGGGKISGLTYADQIVVPINGTIIALGWISKGTTITNAVLKIWVNGVVQATITISGSGATWADGVVTNLNVSVSAGDLVAVEYDAVGSNDALSDSCIELAIK